MSIRGRIISLFTILALVMGSLAGYLSFSLFQVTDKNSAVSLTALKNEITSRAGLLHEFLARSEQAALAVTAQGLTLYESRGNEETREQAEQRYQKALINLLAGFGADSGIFGLGTGYAPGVFWGDQGHFDPYAYWEKGKIAGADTEEDPYYEREWYTLSIPKSWDLARKRDQKTYWTAPYVSKDTGDLMISVSAPMYTHSGRIIGVGFVDVGLSAMDEMVTKTLPLPGAIGFAIYAASGAVTGSPASPDMHMKPITDLPFGTALLQQARDALQGRQKVLSVTYKNAEWECFSVDIGGGMAVSMLLPKEKIFAASKAEQLRVIWTCTLAALLLGSIIASAVLFMMRKVVKPVRDLADYADAVARGDYQKTASGNFVGELGILREALLTMVNELQQRMADSQARSEEAAKRAEEAQRLQRVAAEKAKAEEQRIKTLHEAAQVLAGVGSEVRGIIESVQAQSSRIAGGAEQQLDRLHETMDQVREMEHTILQIADNARISADSAGTSSTLTQEGKSSLMRTVTAMGGLEQKMQDLSREMNNLGEQAKSIGNIMNVISDIADQTNLLALNAAIEAARAGEAGRGFAVVADEVRKLAEKTMQATGEVERSIRSIQGTSRSSMESMQEALAEVSGVARLSQEADNVLLSATRSADSAAEQVQQIAGATSHQTQAAQKLASAVDLCSNIAKETADNAARTGETLKELVTQTAKLATIIEQLQQR